MMTAKAALVWCPFPDETVARTICDKLLEEKLTACANIFGAINVMFEWDGARNEGVEVPVLFKTNSDTLARLTARLGDLHPYETPAILGWHCDAGHPSTLAWLGALGTGASD